jgi:hypothetical protein
MARVAEKKNAGDGESADFTVNADDALNFEHVHDEVDFFRCNSRCSQDKKRTGTCDEQAPG